MKYLSAQVLLGLCLSGVLADLPYHDFEGKLDVHSRDKGIPKD
jgi:hypothetical protein